MMEETYRFTNEDKEFYFHKDNSDKDKYIVFTCAKNENDYIVEWVNHYLNYGFDKIIICDNNDDNSLEDILYDYIKNGTVELFDFRGFKDCFQIQAYRDFAHYANYKWCAYFDCDEFLELGCYTNIKDFLATINEDDNVVCFNWLTFGPNLQITKEEGTVQERFKNPEYPICMFKENMMIKSILRGVPNTIDWFNGSHLPISEPIMHQNLGGYNYIYKANDSHNIFPMRYKRGYIKHYYTKSIEEYIAKVSRGWPDGTATLDVSKMLCFDKHPEKNLSEFNTGIFIYGKDNKKVLETMKYYSVIVFSINKGRVYAFYIILNQLMSEVSGHTFVLKGDDIDDTYFNMLLEMAYKTNNNLVFAFNEDEVYRAFKKYRKESEDTYYIYSLG